MRALAALLLSLPLCAQAAQGDRLRPITLDSQAGGEINLQTRRVEYRGNVLLTQGTLQLRAERIEVQERADQSVLAIAHGMPSQPVRFEQARDVPGERITGQAERVEFDNGAETVRFAGGATVRRMRNGQVADEVSGAVIVYNSRSETFAVEGGQTAPQPGGRVRVILMPRANAGAPSAPEPAASAVPLRTSPALPPR